MERDHLLNISQAEDLCGLEWDNDDVTTDNLTTQCATYSGTWKGRNQTSISEYW